MLLRSVFLAFVSLATSVLATRPLPAELDPRQVKISLVGRSINAGARRLPILSKRWASPVAPKIVIISLFGPEQDVWIEPLKLTHDIVRFY